jgi:hypothetical protein
MDMAIGTGKNTLVIAHNRECDEGARQKGNSRGEDTKSVFGDMKDVSGCQEIIRQVRLQLLRLAILMAVVLKVGVARSGDGAMG